MKSEYYKWIRLPGGGPDQLPTSSTVEVVSVPVFNNDCSQTTRRFTKHMVEQERALHLKLLHFFREGYNS